MIRTVPDEYPSRIVCLTEETTETLYLLGEQDRIAGISGFTVRPPEARRDKPKVSAFTSAKIDKIVALSPDLVLGFSDLQRDIADRLGSGKSGLHVVIGANDAGDQADASEQPRRQQRDHRTEMPVAPYVTCVGFFYRWIMHSTGVFGRLHRFLLAL